MCCSKSITNIKQANQLLYKAFQFICTTQCFPHTAPSHRATAAQYGFAAHPVVALSGACICVCVFAMFVCKYCYGNRCSSKVLTVNLLELT